MPKQQSPLRRLFAAGQAAQRARGREAVPIPPWYAELGGRIQYARSRAGLSQGDVAKHLKCSRVSVSYWEAGLRMPSVLDAARLAVVLEVSADWLLCGVEYAKREDYDFAA